MSKGGARVASGPAPSPQSRRQQRSSVWTWLPAEGYTGPIPEWPLLAGTARERAVWRRLWRTPQAAAWARLGWPDHVAIYVRQMVLTEGGDKRAAAEARRADPEE